MNRLKYTGYSIVFQEVPDEVTLAINISGCPHKCEGCHSKYLWEYEGDYIDEDIEKLICRYKKFITCVCFMGGDQNPSNLIHCLSIAKKYGFKTCLYSGRDDLRSLYTDGLIDQCDYVKIGRYNQQLGGLNSPNTNQRFYKRIDGVFEDITYLFQKDGKIND